MDKHVINASPVPVHTEEQLDWVRLLERSHNNPESKAIAPLILGSSRAGKTRLVVEGALKAGGTRHE